MVVVYVAGLLALVLVFGLAMRRLLPRWWRLLACLPVVPVAALFGFAYLAPLESPYGRATTPGALVLAADGSILQRDAAAGLRIPVSLQAIAPAVVDATIAAEDERFRSHPGVDPFATVRALVHFPWRQSGASTLTQQLARNLYLQDYDGPVLERKAREALVALQLEARYSKDEILALYLNNVYFGRNAYGIEAAARTYFGVSAANLDLAQSAYLAGLPQAPGFYGDNPESESTRGRQRYVLSRMAAGGRIDEADARAAMDEPLALFPRQAGVAAPHFVEFAMTELERVAPELRERNGIVVQTTLDAGLQTESEDIARYYVKSLEARDVTNGAVVVIEPESGRLLTMVGSVNFDDTAIAGQVNMTIRPRQPGSALKPFIYIAAFEQGMTAASPLLDVSTSFATASGPYAPLNFDRRFNGVVPLRVALASSLNVPAVATLEAVGTDAFLDVAHRFGLNTLNESEVYGPALALGAGEVTLLDLTAAYGGLANGGAVQRPYAVERVTDARGRVLYARKPAAPSVATTAERAYIISEILADADARTLGFGDAPEFRLPFAAAVKTGTTTEFRDNWAVGYTPERVVGAWVGNANNAPMQDVSGVSGAAPIWRAVMEAAHRGVTPTWPVAPRDLVRATVCAPTGLRPGSDCPSPIDEWFVAGTEPRDVETLYGRAENGSLVVNLPSAARPWAASASLPVNNASSGDARIVYPPDGSRFFLAPELREQAIVLRASAPGYASLELWVDGLLLTESSGADLSFPVPVRLGVHRIELRTSATEGARTLTTSKFEVLP